jgi:hypothetical protein
MVGSLNAVAATEYTFNQTSIKALQYDPATTHIYEFHGLYEDKKGDDKPWKVYYYTDYSFSTVRGVNFGDTIKVTLPDQEDGGKIEYNSNWESQNEFVKLANITSKKIGKTKYNTYTFTVLDRGTRHYDNIDSLYFNAFHKNGYDGVTKKPPKKLTLCYGFVIEP